MGQMGQMKKQGKHLQDQINDEEIDYLPNIDNKDNPKPQKQKGGTDQENSAVKQGPMFIRAPYLV